MKHRIAPIGTLLRSYSTKSGFSVKKSPLQAKKTSFTHEYSVSPTTFQFRLPSSEHDQHYSFPYSASSPFSILFEYLSNHPLNGYTTKAFFDLFPLTTFKRLSKSADRPKKVKMLTGDFIDDSLYNPNYGYFSQQAKIFQTETPFNYENLSDNDAFISNWSERYDKYNSKDKALQLWHTPTELFQPHYGEAIARYLLVNYKLNLYPYSDLIIYEIGGGNGTLMMNILNFIKRVQPEVYSKTQYKIIEISKNLSDKQKVNSLKLKIQQSEHDAKIQIINKSILDWDEYVPEPCFIVGMEVMDNLSHDVIKYDIETGQPYQGYVVIDEHQDFHQFFSPELDEWTQLYLELRKDEVDLSENSLFKRGKSNPLASNKKLAKLKNWLSPFKNSLSESEFIPTRLLKIFSVIHEYFPDHQLILSDFDSLPDRSEGYNSPVVQTMIPPNKVVTASTYMVHQGYFDIMFPTDFHLMRDLYIKICGRIVKTSKQSEFLSTWADIEKTTLKNGENPLLSFYSNASFLHS
jgi:hypothetical protein